MTTKQQLIQVHGLLAQVAEHMTEEHNATIETDEYDEVGVGPTDIHKGKKAHKEAVLALANCIAESVPNEASTPAVETAKMTAGEES